MRAWLVLSVLVVLLAFVALPGEAQIEMLGSQYAVVDDGSSDGSDDEPSDDDSSDDSGGDGSSDDGRVAVLYVGCLVGAARQLWRVAAWPQLVPVASWKFAMNTRLGGVPIGVPIPPKLAE